MPSYYHIVVFKLKPDLPQENRDELKNRFLSMKTGCVKDGKTYMISIKGGDQTSKEFMAQGMDLTFIIEFSSKEDRQYYHKQDSYHRDFIPKCIEYTSGGFALDCEDE